MIPYVLSMLNYYMILIIINPGDYSVNPEKAALFSFQMLLFNRPT